MGKMNYFVAVFVGGKNVGTHYSDDLSELVTLKAMYRGCEVEILDLHTYRNLSIEEVREKVNQSRERWKEVMTHKQDDVNEGEVKKALRRNTMREKLWKRQVMCQETGQVFGSVRECCEMVGIPYMTLINCIKNGNATRGLHFLNVPRKDGEND